MRKALILLCLLLFGCSSKSTSVNGADATLDSAAGDVVAAGDSTSNSVCTSDAQCSPGKCDLASGVCRPTCAGPADCTAGYDCDGAQGVCVPATSCTDDGPCGAGFCSCRGSCVSGKKCKTRSNCGLNEYCDTYPKTDPSDCFGTCQTVKGLCNQCSSDGECGTGNRCLTYSDGKKYCGVKCVADAECLAKKAGFVCKDLGGGKQCVPISGSCEAPGQCQSTADCQFGEYCGQNLTCVTGCSSDNACAKPQVCSAYRCQDACSDQKLCETGFACEDGHCKIPDSCASSSDCPAKATYCNTQQHKCVPGCLVDNDCKDATKKCENKSCVEKGCLGAYQCAFGNVCNTTTGKCEKAQGPYCDVCDPQQSGACGSDQNLCVSFKDEDDKDLGSFCLVACSSDPNNPCPAGYQCTETEQGKVCHRACYQKPVGAQ